ncbi:MAG: gluconate 2-dehydrogenase subunit 3 family protein [Lutimonas sp.]
MKRREALKNLSLGIGYVVSAPTLLGVLESCSKPDPAWKAVFLSDEVKPLVNHLVEIILPRSESPGGQDLDLQRFVDKMCGDILSKTDQQWVAKGGALFAEKVASYAGKDATRADHSDVLEVFKTYFDLPPDEKKAVLDGQNNGAGNMNDEEKDNFALYKFLLTTREFALLGYFTSERIGTEVLVFDPIPGGYKPCIPLSEVGNAWTIG